MHDFKVGDEAYFEEAWTENIIGGKVIETGMTEANKWNPSVPFVKVQIGKYEKRSQVMSKCYPSRESALAAQQAKNEAILEKYRSKIQTVNDLVTFMYNNNVHNGTEYTDWNARQVAREKAKELCGLELGN